MKKIFTLGIIGMFLLTGLGMTVVGMETTSNVKSLNDEIIAEIWVGARLGRIYWNPDESTTYVEIQEVDADGNPISEKITLRNGYQHPTTNAVVFEANVNEGALYDISAHSDDEGFESGSVDKWSFYDDYPEDGRADHECPLFISKKGKSNSIKPLLNNVLARILDNHPNMFPLLRAILGL